MAGRSSTGNQRAFTLIEALVAMVIFALITFTLSLALSTALNAHEVTLRHQEQTGTLRAVFGALTRDLQAAHASMADPTSVFIAKSTQGNGAQNSADDVLTLTTLSHQVQAEELLDVAPGGAAANPNSTSAPSNPQWNGSLVHYKLDPQTGALSRTESTVPTSQNQNTTQPTPADILAQNVIGLTLRFWDPTTKDWRDTWDYQQQNQSQPSATTGQAASASTGQSGTGTDTTGTGGQTASNNATGDANPGTGDSTLPTAVEVTLVVRNEYRRPVTYTTTIPILATQPQSTTTPTTSNTTGQNTGQGTNQSGSGQGSSNSGQTSSNGGG